MKVAAFVIALLSVSANAATGQGVAPNQATAIVGQSDTASQGNNLRGLKGVRLVVMFGRADAVEETERAAILKLVEADATAKLETAGIPLFRFARELEEAGSPQLMVRITCDTPNGFVYPLVTHVTLTQRVHLARDSSISADAVTWERRGIGFPTLTIAMMRQQVSTAIDQFISDYASANPK